MATIGISGSYGGLNLGDEAILTSMLATLRERCPGDELVVFSRNAEQTRADHDPDRVVPVRELDRDGILPEIERLDLLVVGGGGILYDGEARIFLREVRLAQERGIPTAAYAIGAGPLQDPDDRAAVRDHLGRMAVVTVRDQGAKRLLEDVGVERPVEVTADPALLLRPEPFTAEMLSHEGAPAGRALVGMSVREPGKAAPDLDVEGYHALLAEVGDFVVHRFGADVLFVAMERDDIRHSHAVIGHMLAADRAHVLKGTYRPAQLLGLTEHLDMVIGMRLHFLIFAALGSVPFLPLPYAQKVGDFVEAVGVRPPAPVARQATGPLLAAIDRAWDLRGQERERLAGAIRPVVAQAQRTADLVLKAWQEWVPGAAEHRTG